MLSHKKTACRPTPGRQAVFGKRGIFSLCFSILLAVLIAVADQLIKLWVERDFALGESREWLKIGGNKLINLTYVLNDGIAFSAFAGQRILITIIPFLLLAFCVLAILHYGGKSRLLTAGIGLCMGGGIGNLIDRLFNDGMVIDYLDVQLFQFAVFNFADCCICIGVVLAGIFLIFGDDSQKAPDKTPESNSPTAPEDEHV